jgi:predicted ATPase
MTATGSLRSGRFANCFPWVTPKFHGISVSRVTPLSFNHYYKVKQLISDLHVDGFKSLSDFGLHFKKGLNVLIGSNGAGKTNICQALGLFAAAADGHISVYLLSLGGSSSIFTTDCECDIALQPKKAIKAGCVGEFTEDDATLKYKYSISVEYTDEIRISEERFQLFKKTPKRPHYRIILDAKRSSDSKVNINIRDLNEIGLIERKAFGDKKRISIKIRSNLETICPFLSYFSFYCYMTFDDMKFSTAWNIDPHLAKIPSDILEPSRMLPDGRRLSNAIHELSVANDERMSEIDTMLSRILPGYSHVEATTSCGQRTFRIQDTRGLKCPSFGLSDGTIKILAVLVGVLSKEHTTSIIEEPENYLHPWASQLLMEFFRDKFAGRVCILTTHSETILNVIKPNEIIIVENIIGCTNARRVDNERQLVEAIRSSGFGCGYHYLAGSLGGTPE